MASRPALSSPLSPRMGYTWGKLLGGVMVMGWGSGGGGGVHFFSSTYPLASSTFLFALPGVCIPRTGVNGLFCLRTSMSHSLQPQCVAPQASWSPGVASLPEPLMSFPAIPAAPEGPQRASWRPLCSVKTIRRVE